MVPLVKCVLITTTNRFCARRPDNMIAMPRHAMRIMIAIAIFALAVTAEPKFRVEDGNIILQVATNKSMQMK